jgi:hypothetical protein
MRVCHIGGLLPRHLGEDRVVRLMESCKEDIAVVVHKVARTHPGNNCLAAERKWKTPRSIHMAGYCRQELKVQPCN